MEGYGGVEALDHFDVAPDGLRVLVEARFRLERGHCPLLLILSTLHLSTLTALSSAFVCFCFCLRLLYSVQSSLLFTVRVSTFFKTSLRKSCIGRREAV